MVRSRPCFEALFRNSLGKDVEIPEAGCELVIGSVHDEQQRENMPPQVLAVASMLSLSICVASLTHLIYGVYL